MGTLEEAQMGGFYHAELPWIPEYLNQPNSL